jgi:hypothetical protein
MDKCECFDFRSDDMGTITCHSCGEEACTIVSDLRDDFETLLIVLRKCRKLAKNALDECSVSYARDNMEKIIETVGETLELVNGNRK